MQQFAKQKFPRDGIKEGRGRGEGARGACFRATELRAVRHEAPSRCSLGTLMESNLKPPPLPPLSLIPREKGDTCRRDQRQFKIPSRRRRRDNGRNDGSLTIETFRISINRASLINYETGAINENREMRATCCPSLLEHELVIIRKHTACARARARQSS